MRFKIQKSKGEHTIYYKPGMYVHLIKPNTRDGTLTADSVRHMSFASSPSHDKNIISFAMDVGSGSMFKIAMEQEYYQNHNCFNTCAMNSSVARF